MTARRPLELLERLRVRTDEPTMVGVADKAVTLGGIYLMLEIFRTVYSVLGDLWAWGRWLWSALGLGLVLVMLPAPAGALTTDSQEDICASAAVIWCENFTNWPLGAWQNIAGQSKFKMPGWGVSQSFDLDIVAETPNATFGTKALRFTYPSGFNTGGGFGDSIWGGNHRSLYYRGYTKFSTNFKISGASTKHWELSSPFSGSFNGLFSRQFGNAEFDHNIVGFQYPPGVQLSAYNWYQNLNLPGLGSALHDNLWHCFEVHWTQNTFDGPDAFGGFRPNNDGSIEGWIDGVQKWSYTGLILDPANLNGRPAGAPNNLQGTLISAYWNCMDDNCDSGNPANFHPLMFRTDTNFVVSTARIGCFGAAPPQNPAPPSNLRFVSVILTALALAALVAKLSVSL